MKKVIFPGCFDPFTNGHKAVVDQIVDQCDEFIIAIAANLNKRNGFIPIEDRIKMIQEIYKNKPQVKVIDITSTIITEYCKANDIKYIVRGIRNSSDFEYEKGLAEMNFYLGGIQTMLVFGFCEPHGINISSTFVRERIHYGLSIQEFVPAPVVQYIIKNKLTY